MLKASPFPLLSFFLSLMLQPNPKMPQGPTAKIKIKRKKKRQDTERETGRKGRGWRKVGRGEKERERERVLNTISPLGSNFHRWRGHHCLTVCCHVNLVWQDKAVISAWRGCKPPAIQGHARVDLHCISLYTIAVTKPPEFPHVNLFSPALTRCQSGTEDRGKPGKLGAFHIQSTPALPPPPPKKRCLGLW